MQGYLDCGFIASTGALLIVRPYIRFLLAVSISSLTNHSNVSTCAIFKQVVSNQNHFTIFHLPVLTMVLDCRQVVPNHLVIREPIYPSWVP